MTDPIELTDREEAVAAICSTRVVGSLRRVILAGAMVAFIVIAGSVFGWLAIRQESVKRTDAIQASRVQVLIDSCQETNARNQDALAKLDRLLPKHPNSMERLRSQSTKLLIGALVPYRPNCELYAHVRLAPQ